MKQGFLIITAQQVNDILSNHHDDIYELVKKVYIQHEEKETTNPPSYFLRFPDKPKSRIIALPAAIKNNPRVAGIKWIASNPDNFKEGLERASAVIILNNYDTGYPYACLEGSAISAIRTSYSAAAAAGSFIQHKKAETVGVMGTGRIAFNILKCLDLNQWDIETLLLYDTLDTRVDDFIKLLSKNNIRFSRVAQKVTNKNKLLKESALVIFTTTAAEPHVSDINLLKKEAVLLNISLRDLSPEVIINSNNIVDDIEHVLQAKTSPHLTQEKYKTEAFINGTIGDFLRGSIDLDKNKVTVFSPMGLGVLDIAISDFVYEKLKDQESTIKINNFFG